MKVQFSMLAVLILAGAACGPAPTARPPAVTVILVTATPVEVNITPAATPAATKTLYGPFPLEAVAWLRAHAIPLVTSQPGTGFADLAPLRDIIGSARIVALGEATHGTHEFFQMKHRLLEYLVDEMGFTSFAIEANWLEANLINDYIQAGQGDPVQLLAGLGYWTWDTQEVLDLILWMRAHNANPANGPRVSFYGLDIQSPWPAMDSVVAYLQEVDPNASAWADGRYDCLRQYQNAGSKYAAATPDVRQQCRSALQAVYDLLVRRRAIFENQTSVSDYEFTLQSARIPLQTEQYFAGHYVGPARDQAMADNVTTLLHQAGPASKLVVWAHNVHIGALQDEPSGFKSMGWDLRQAYGADMVTIGFSLYHGSFNAGTNGGYVIVPHPLPAPLPDSYESFFQTANLPRLLVDLRGVARDLPATAWLLGPHPEYWLGVSYTEAFPNTYLRSAYLPQEYDVMIHFQDTTPSKLLPSSTQ